MYTKFSIKNTKFHPNSVFMYFVYISDEQPVLPYIALRDFFFITENRCLLRGTDWAFK